MKKENHEIIIHSVTDLITNSSTTIYTISDKSKPAVIDMIDGFLKIFNIDKKAEDMFSIEVLFKDDYTYYEIYESQLPLDITREIAKRIVKDVKAGLITKPSWMDEMEKSVDDTDEWIPNTTLYLFPKSPEYADLATKIIKFLYSPESGECMC